MFDVSGRKPQQGSNADATHVADPLEALSALMDGQADAAQLERVAKQWRQSADVRARWHAWHVIGDGLRSEDLAGHAQRDEAFLQSLRLKLAQEPVVMAPSPESAPSKARASWSQWVAPAAVAASFVALAGVLLGLSVQDDPGAWSAGSMLANVSRPASAAPPLPPNTQHSAILGAAANGQPVLIVIAAPPATWQPVHLHHDMATHGTWLGGVATLPSSGVWVRPTPDAPAR